MLKAIVILPFNVTVVIPAPVLWLGLLLLAAGLSGFIRTVSLFVRFGRGSLAPRDPPKHFGVRGAARLHPALPGDTLVHRQTGIVSTRLGARVSEDS